MFNQEGECGTGALVPWAGRLWVITYGPHLPFGSSDKLYEITPELTQLIRPESICGTPANRMIHKESNQLAIGPYLIDSAGKVRVIPWQKMPGRLTGSARHLTDPANKIYYATMEEALYEVDVHSLQVRGLIKDGNPVPKSISTAEDHQAPVSYTLPGYHGTGLYSGQGRVVYANNGARFFDHTTVVLGPQPKRRSQPHQRLPLIIGGGLDIKFGHHFVASKDTPLCNAWLNLLRSSGLSLERHCDRSGVLKEMIA